jgi:nicotinamidase/pyrazinamidase
MFDVEIPRFFCVRSAEAIRLMRPPNRGRLLFDRAVLIQLPVGGARSPMKSPRLSSSDALLLVDVQNDFCPGGALPVAQGDRILPVLNRWVEAAQHSGATIVASRDWHPPRHISFHDRGGPWPAHCVQGTPGAEFHPELRLPQDHLLVSKGNDPEVDRYSDFDQSGLADELRRRGVTRLWVGGLALDVCVRATVLDGLARGFEVHVIAAGTRAVDPHREAEVLSELATAGAVIELEAS